MSIPKTPGKDYVASPTQFSHAPRTDVGQRTVPLGAQRILGLDVTSRGQSFGHMDDHYYLFAPGLLFRVCREGEEPTAVYPMGLGRVPTRGVPLVQAAIVDLSALTPAQLKAEEAAIRRYQAKRGVTKQEVTQQR